MIFIVLIIVGGIILLLKQFGVINNPIAVFLVAAMIVGVSAFIFKDRINCPFANRCPFTICPLNKAK